MPKILSITKAPEQFTADIEVAGTHSYTIVAGNQEIISHNSVSLLAGVTPGIHFPQSRCYIRRVRLMLKSHLLPILKDAGFNIEPCIGSEKSTVVVEFPIKLDDNIRTCDEVSMWEKIELAAFVQQYYSDNLVSVTVDFNVETEGHMIAAALNYAQYKLKAISFLPRYKTGTVYPQSPYEAISEEKYHEMISKLKLPLNFHPQHLSKCEEVELDNMCDGEKCVR